MESENREYLKRVLEDVRQHPVSGLRDTPHGALYEPRPFALQIVLLFVAFAGSPGIGWLSTLFLENISQSKQLLFEVPPILVFLFGYALWSARLAAIAFDMIGRAVFRALFQIIVNRRKPDRIEDILPNREKLELMAVRAQKAGRSFAIVGVLVGLLAGAVAFLLFGIAGALTASLTCVVWGYVLGTLGRRGYLPLPEPE